ncbi:D-alanyl-D-alanine carboxypeptidase [Pseudooceanicola sediminis]|uniref:serine-type D-Ala-D-Ala carboxypeptidase n=1 Tax=Pseudooceanicola sediminis TaxID=2211117 RepID=A0A399J0W7_9RHOB|nr:D-alanyl-D-alanine carboxypeptidase family protein [Pseudooceanicola sediminis]KAA2315159.1 D-alanyl-D-alanine carboxypeptidase [Puniceibacterium sp. HSS470]RII39015.1 D-alanyl-D-alanine carboxypeptidase [Pseudooceanicola sediminis]|tara:strand:+ start:6166 stop:7374 length:1209 start_codon:yes stop_codon:yes gene_type:complete
MQLSPLRPGSGVLAAAFLALTCLPAQAFDTSARAAYIVDITTETVLLAKQADEPIPPASMSKLMTLYVAFEAIRDGRLRMDEELPVSQHAMDYGGSTMFLDTTDHVKVQDLLQGIIVLSGNDACAVIAEALSPDGTEAGFARFMTKRAQELGMTSSTFANSNGWPDPMQRMSVRDLALLATHIINDFPDFYPLFSETEYAFDGRAPQNVHNRNPLLGLGIGADGLKTGHTSEAGYGLVGSAKQDGRRIVFVVSGLDSVQARAEESRSIVNWAFRQFKESTVIPQGEVITRAAVFQGDQPDVGLTVAKDLVTLVPFLSSQGIPSEVVYDSPLAAPIARGQEVGHLLMKPEGLPEMRVPLVAAEAVSYGGFMAKVQSAARYLMRRMNEGPTDTAAPETAPEATS